MNDTTDWYDVKRIGSGSYQITEGKGCLPCNSFVVTDDDQTVLIDTGLGIGDLRAVVEDLAGSNVRVLLTHSHWDHIGAAHQFEEHYVDAAEVADDGRVKIDGVSDEFVDRPRQFVADWIESGKSFPRGFDPDAYSIEPVDDVEVISHGDRLSVGDRSLEIIAVPGHSPGQIAVLDGETGICYGADVLEPGRRIYAHFEDSNLDAYRDSVERLISRRDEGSFHVLTTGHADPIRGKELSVLDDVAEALDAVVSGNVPFEIVQTNWGPAHKHDIGNVTILTRS